MKFINIQLLTMALLLAFKPGIELIFMPDTSEQSCCIDTCSSADLEVEEETHNDCEDKGCEGNFCNPFQVCGSCFVICESLPTTQPSYLAIVDKQLFVYQLNASSLFTIEFWQPPELA